MKHLKISALCLSVFLSLTSCSSDDNSTAPVNEEEVITTVQAVFTPVGDGTAVTLTSRDPDGDGPLAPVVTTSGVFSRGRTYNGTVSFFNELVTPTDNITSEIFQEADEHQLFFGLGTNLGNITYSDEDNNGNPVGLFVDFNTTSEAATGNLTITLIHEPNKTAAGVAQGNNANAGGNTDAQVNFPIVIQ